jgi:hypothetical protein
VTLGHLFFTPSGFQVVKAPPAEAACYQTLMPFSFITLLVEVTCFRVFRLLALPDPDTVLQHVLTAFRRVLGPYAT